MLDCVQQAAAGEVGVWRIRLDQPAHVYHACRALLAADEAARADRFLFAEDRQTFTIAHGAMRQVLGRCLDAAPHHVLLRNTATGKPQVVFPLTRPLAFNLSHSGCLAVLAITTGARVGIDVEHQARGAVNAAIADQFFSAREAAALRSMPPDQRHEAFLECWTRKEAYVKALGVGLSMPLDTFDVAFGPGATPALLHVKGCPQEPNRWRMHRLAVGPSYTGALIVEGHAHDVRYYDWCLADFPAIRVRIKVEGRSYVDHRSTRMLPSP